MKKAFQIGLIGAGIVTVVSYGKFYIDIKKFEQDFARNKKHRKYY
jgi:hypothetical protein